MLTAANDSVIQGSDDWNSGYASFQLMAMTDTATFTTTFSRIFKGGQWFDDQGTPMSGSAATPAAVRFPKVARSNAVTPIARRATLQMPLDVQPHVGAIANGCMIVSRQDIGHQRQPDDVGEMHNPHDMTTNTYFKYGNTADSSISVGFTESDSGFGGWGVNGTAELSVGHGSSAGDLRPYPEGRWSHRIDIDMDVHEYRYHRQCYARGYRPGWGRPQSLGSPARAG